MTLLTPDEAAVVAVSPFDTVVGLPVHALVVHATVVLVPLVMLAVIAVAVRPRWRSAFGWYVVAAAVVVVPLVGVTILSGREFKSRIGASPQILRHEDLGNTLFWFSLAVALVSVVLVAAHRRTADAVKPGALVTVVAVVAVAIAGVTLVQVVRTGHAGSVAVWESIVESTGG